MQFVEDIKSLDMTQIEVMVLVVIAAVLAAYWDEIKSLFK